MTSSVTSVCEGRLHGSVLDFILHCQWDCTSIYPISSVYLGLGSRRKKPKQKSPDLPLKTLKFKDLEVLTNTLVLSAYICHGSGSLTQCFVFWTYESCLFIVLILNIWLCFLV